MTVVGGNDSGLSPQLVGTVSGLAFAQVRHAVANGQSLSQRLVRRTRRAARFCSPLMSLHLVAADVSTMGSHLLVPGKVRFAALPSSVWPVPIGRRADVGGTGGT